METAELPRVTGRHQNKALAQQRRTRAVELAVGGHSYQAVADEMGYANRGTVYRIVQEALKARQITSIDEVRELEASRLDALQAALWSEALNGDHRAVAMVLKVMNQWAKLLGLHAVSRGEDRAHSENLGATGQEGHLYDFATMSLLPLGSSS